MRAKTLAYGLLLLACMTAKGVSAGDVNDAVITKIAISKGLGDILFILVDKPKGSTPACHSNLSWTYVLPLSTELDKKIYALLLTARSTQAPITFSGTGQCEVFGSIETLQTAAY